MSEGIPAPTAPAAPEVSVDPSAGGEAPEANAKPAEDLPEWKKIKHKLPSGDELDYDDLTRLAEKGRGADNKYREAADMRKSAESQTAQVKQIMEHLQTNDPKALKQFLMQSASKEAVLAAAEELVWEQLQNEGKYKDLDPKVAERLRRADELEARAKEWDERETKEKQTAEESKHTEAVDHWSGEYDKLIGGAIEASGDLPKNAQTVARMAQYISACLEADIPVDAKDMTEAVRESYKSEFSAMVGSMTPEQVAKLFGDDTIKKVREYDLSKIKDPRQRMQEPIRVNGAAPKVKEWISPNEMRERAMARALGK